MGVVSHHSVRRAITRDDVPIVNRLHNTRRQFRGSNRISRSRSLQLPVPNVRAGAIIRFLRRARYSFYKSSDGEWYLGYRRCSVGTPSSCASIQPVSGPYRAYKGSSSPSGIAFRYYDVNGAQLTSTRAIDIGESSGHRPARRDGRQRRACRRREKNMARFRNRFGLAAKSRSDENAIRVRTRRRDRRPRPRSACSSPADSSRATRKVIRPARSWPTSKQPHSPSVRQSWR